MDITINVNAPELVQSINLLAQALAGKTAAPINGQAVAQAVAQMMPPPVVPTQMPIPAPVQVPAPQPQAPPAMVPTAGPPTYTSDQLANAAAELVRTGRMQELQGLLTKYGVPALPHLKPEQYGAFATDLRALGGKL